MATNMPAHTHGPHENTIALAELSPIPPSRNVNSIEAAGARTTRGKPHKPVDVNIMKRNMSIAKGFMDISLLSANANQLRNLFNFGDSASGTFYVILCGLLLSIILQLFTGVVLILKERYDLNNEHDHEWCEKLNNVTLVTVFLIVVVNVFISSFGVDSMNPSLIHPSSTLPLNRSHTGRL